MMEFIKNSAFFWSDDKSDRLRDRTYPEKEIQNGDF